eukprot:Gb_10848 [translate_table: standard]
MGFPVWGFPTRRIPFFFKYSAVGFADPMKHLSKGPILCIRFSKDWRVERRSSYGCVSLSDGTEDRYGPVFVDATESHGEHSPSNPVNRASHNHQKSTQISPQMPLEFAAPLIGHSADFKTIF